MPRWFGPRKSSPPPIEPLQPLAHIADAFRHYISNHIPARLIDTSKLTFVERDAVYDVFATEIAQVTEEDVQRRIGTVGIDTDPEAGIYIPLRKAALRETIRDVVKYAIFSHRWTAIEPSYQDVSAYRGLSLGRQRITKSVGLAKLVQLCETARALGYKLVWSDTCCINKTNPAELNEAIHAMFKWYAHAHLCIVHLSASSSLADFERELWFTRGWTLQELLAPRRIKFYDQGWRAFTTLANDKDDLMLMSALSDVTGIPQDVVVADNSRGIRGRGVWEIMSWAATRKTTRIEDAAYCLYGLFDVHPTIAYGEGEKAFPRLVEAIVERYHTWDVFAWSGQASERHPALPCSPACYPRWDAAMVSGEVGMTEFALTPHGLRLTSVPLIPMVFASEARDADRGSFTVTLRARSDTAMTLGVYGDVTVVCGSGRLRHIRDAVDLHACILNYKPSRRSLRGELQAGRTYVCFLLYIKGRNAEGSTWLKVATDNVLRIACRGVPAGTSEMEDGGFDLPLTTTYIRAPAQSQATLPV
ncbi:HET-domain-containing protein [Imleria badia]|nr:HET-domain-containing protein [Imleria badia]